MSFLGGNECDWCGGCYTCDSHITCRQEREVEHDLQEIKQVIDELLNMPREERCDILIKAKKEWDNYLMAAQRSHRINGWRAKYSDLDIKKHLTPLSGKHRSNVNAKKSPDELISKESD